MRRNESDGSLSSMLRNESVESLTSMVSDSDGSEAPNTRSRFNSFDRRGSGDSNCQDIFPSASLPPPPGEGTEANNQQQPAARPRMMSIEEGKPPALGDQEVAADEIGGVNNARGRRRGLVHRSVGGSSDTGLVPQDMMAALMGHLGEGGGVVTTHGLAPLAKKGRLWLYQVDDNGDGKPRWALWKSVLAWGLGLSGISRRREMMAGQGVQAFSSVSSVQTLTSQTLDNQVARRGRPPQPGGVWLVGGQEIRRKVCRGGPITSRAYSRL